MKFSRVLVLPVASVLGTGETFWYFQDTDFATATGPGPSGPDCTAVSAEGICMTDVAGKGRTAWAAAAKPTVTAFDWSTPGTESVVITAEGVTLPCTPVDPITNCAYHPNFIDKAPTVAPWLAQVMPKTSLDTATITGSRNCLFQWNIGGQTVVKETATIDTIQKCQDACIKKAAPGCDVWTYKQTGATTGECYLYDSTIWATLDQSPGTGAGDKCMLTSTGEPTENEYWATCASDATIKICAKMDGNTISGRRLCDDETLTPTLEWLQANATVCVPDTTTTAPPNPDAETTNPTTAVTSSGSDEETTTTASSSATTRIGVAGYALGVATLMVML